MGDNLYASVTREARTIVFIDAHLHVGEYLRHYPENFAVQMMGSVGQAAATITTHIPSILAEMDQVGVDKAFLLAFDAQRTLGVKVPDSYVAEICRAHSDRFIGFCSVDAGVPGAAEAVYHSATTLGLRGVKIAPAYVNLSPADRCWYETYKVAETLSLPILVHTGFTPARQASPRYFPPMLMSQVAQDFPQVRFILAHLGSPWVKQCLDLLVKYPNLYADISIFGWHQPVEVLAQTLASARKQGVIDRLLWGTDYPWGPITAYVKRMQLLMQDSAIFPDGQALTEQEWHQLTGATALSLLAPLDRK